jgi:hypothetical protein
MNEGIFIKTEKKDSSIFKNKESISSGKLIELQKILKEETEKLD